MKIILSILTSMGLALSAHATDAPNGGQSKQDLKKLQKEKSAEDIDKEITNARMRAESGSKNKYSLSISLAYQGGTVGEPFGEERPEIYGDPETRSKTDISGGIDARYRITANDSITAGASLALLTPFVGDVSGEDGQFEINNPEVAYTRSFKVGETQNRLKTWYTLGTEQGWADVDLLGQLAVSHTILTTLKKMPLTMGTSLQLVRNLYANEYESGKRNVYSVGLYPFMEYAFNDTYSFRTVFGYFNWRLREEKEAGKYVSFRANSYQSMGVGISITRDIYLYPNIQFLPEEAELDKTNVGLSTTINI